MEKNVILLSLEKEEVIGEKAKMIESAFLPMIELIKAVESEFAEIIAKEPGEESCKEARDLRLKLVKVRTSTAAIHKEQKAEYLRAGRAIDGVKNILEFAIVDKEEALLKMEKHFENIEKEKLLVLKKEREEMISRFGYDFGNLDLSKIEQSMFDVMLIGAEKAFNDNIAAEKAAEEARIANELKLEQEREAQRIENERLKAEALKREEEIKKEREEQQRVLKEQQAKAAAEKEIADKKAKEEREKQEAILKKEREEKAKIEAELETKRQAEAKAEQERQYAIELELSKGDKEKLDSLCNELEILKNRFSFKSKKNQKLQISINELISKTIAYIKEKQ